MEEGEEEKEDDDEEEEEEGEEGEEEGDKEKRRKLFTYNLSINLLTNQMADQSRKAINVMFER